MTTAYRIPSTKLMQERQSGQRNDGIAGAIHAALTRFGKLDATTAWKIMILLHSPSMTGGEFLLRSSNGAAEL